MIDNALVDQGGIEVIVLGENFYHGLEVSFGEIPAVSTQMWSPNTLVCVLPPSLSAGPVVVGFKGLSITLSANTGLQLFTYLDTSDKALMELALQVVGMKMTGRIDDARNVARRIIGTGTDGGGDTRDPQVPSRSMLAQPIVQATSGDIISKSSFTVGEQLKAMSEDGHIKGLQGVTIKL